MSGPPQGTDSFRAGPVGKAAAILIWITTLGQVALAAWDWRDYAVFKDDLGSFDPEAISVVDVVYLVVALAAAVTYIVWLRQVRTNAERFCKAPHRHRRGWLIAGWIIPIIDLWFPKQIVDDIVAASSPRTPPHADELPRVRAKVVLTWWTLWVASLLLALVDPSYFADRPSAGDLLWTAILTTVTAVLTIACAVYAVRVIELINQLQTSRPWVAWWETTTSVG